VLPALLLGAGALAVSIGSCWIDRLRFWRKAGWFVALSLALGPGLIVNGLLKPSWGRPRPAHIVEFGGTVQYAPVWSPGVAPGAMSFPSGHASMGFFLIVPAFLLYRKHRLLAVLFFALGLCLGSTVGLARMIQGRHFPSDVLWSAACVYYSALFLYILFRFDTRIAPLRRELPPDHLAAEAELTCRKSSFLGSVDIALRNRGKITSVFTSPSPYPLPHGDGGEGT
jgi:membrane-associated PAP2 superfamily phosphatase